MPTSARSTPDSPFPVHCAWCAVDIGFAAVSGSHGICPACFEQLLGIPLLSDAQLSALPFGLIELDSTGVVRRYNAAEQVLSGLHAAEVVGRNFFLEVAPCTAVAEFQGRFADFMRGGAEPASFAFTFPFKRGAVDVHIAFVRTDVDGAFVLVRAEQGVAVATA